MLFSKSRLQIPSAWHQATTSCRLSLSSRQHFPAICSFFQAYTRGKSAVCPTPTIVPLFWVCLVKPRAAALFQLLFSFTIAKQRKHLPSCLVHVQVGFLVGSPVDQESWGCSGSFCLFGGEWSGWCLSSHSAQHPFGLVPVLASRYSAWPWLVCVSAVTPLGLWAPALTFPCLYTSDLLGYGGVSASSAAPAWHRWPAFLSKFKQFGQRIIKWFPVASFCSFSSHPNSRLASLQDFQQVPTPQFWIFCSFSDNLIHWYFCSGDSSFCTSDKLIPHTQCFYVK